jgi:hypothetical protein
VPLKPSQIIDPMLPGVNISHLVTNEFVKSVSSDLIVANVCDLDDFIVVNLAKRQIEGSTTPIKHQNPAAIEFRETAPVICLRS